MVFTGFPEVASSSSELASSSANASKKRRKTSRIDPLRVKNRAKIDQRFEPKSSLERSRSSFERLNALPEAMLARSRRLGALPEAILAHSRLLRNDQNGEALPFKAFHFLGLFRWLIRV